MAVHTLQFHGLVIHVEVAPGQPELVLVGRCLAYLHLANAEVRRHALHHLTFLVRQRGHQHVAVRLFRTPGPCIGDVYLGVWIGVLQRGHHRLRLVGVEPDGIDLIVQHILVLGLHVQELLQLLDALVLALRIANLGLHVHNGRAVAHEGCADSQVANLHLRIGRQVGGAEDARQAEHVLSLQQRTVGVAIHLHSHHVLAVGVQIGGDVEPCRVAAVLREAHVLAVNPEVEERIHAVEIDIDIPEGPLRRHLERAAVRAHFVRIFIHRPLWVARLAHYPTLPIIYSHLMLEDDFLVDVDGHAVLQRPILLYSLNIPTTGHGDIVPRRDIISRSLETFGTFLWCLAPMEFPRAVQTLPVGTAFG